MSIPLNETEIQQLLTELKNDSAKRRWATIRDIMQKGIVDPRVLTALETMAIQDPMPYVREEANTLLLNPSYQNLLQTRGQAQISQPPTNLPNDSPSSLPNDPQPASLATESSILPTVSAPPASTKPPGRPVEERRAVLDQAIQNFVKQGYRVLSRTDTTVQLIKPKSFSVAIALICLLLAIVGIGLLFLIIYIIIYAAQKDETVYLEVDERGDLNTIRK